MMRFNYLGASVPSLVDRARAARLPERLRSPALGLATAVCIVAAWWGIERHALTVALDEERAARVRLEISRSAVAAARLERRGVDRLLALDRRLRAIRLTGSSVGVRLADIANHVPARAWLTTLSQEPDAIDITGRTEGIERLGLTIASLMGTRAVTNPRLVRATREDRPGASSLIAFEVRVDE